MLVGVPREVKNNENRVAVTPAGARALIEAGHRVLVETGAGEGSAFPDDEYEGVGAQVVETAAEVFRRAEMIVKVKEPLPREYDLFRPGQLLFTYLHLAPEPELARALVEREITAVAYETVQLDNGQLPLLTPMSEVAGRMAPQIGAHFLERPQGGRGVLLGGVPGVPPADVVILGGGVVGTNAAKVAGGLGASVTILDISPDRLRYLDDIFDSGVVTLMSNQHNIANAVERADVLIGAVLVPGAKAPNLVSEEMVAAMKPGAVVVDVAIDQGGSIATCDRVTTHDRPTYVRHGVVHYTVANMPGAVPRTSTLSLTNATLRHVLELAGRGFEAAVAATPALARGVNVHRGRITHRAVAEAHGEQYVPLGRLLET